MSRTRRWITVALCAAVVGTVIIPAFIRGDPPATQKAPSPQAGRDLDVISADLKVAGAAFHDAVPTVKLLGDANFRKEHAAAAIPLAKKVADLLNEVITTHPEYASAMDGRYRYLGSAVALGDTQAADILTAACTSKNLSEAISAKSYLTFGQWAAASDDLKAQAKILDSYAEFAKANPKEDQIAATLKVMSQVGPATPDMSNRALAVIQNVLTGELAQQLSLQIAVLDKPLTVAGRTTTNTRFVSSTMKGKVILVDFWATWCEPCKEELPEVKKIYETYHPKGLEMIGVACDDSDTKVNDFIKDAGMPWVQLRENSQSDEENWHPLAKKYGVGGIPTLFLIDKKGVLRYVDAREDTEEKVKKLLAEPDPAPVNEPAPKKGQEPVNGLVPGK